MIKITQQNLVDFCGAHPTIALYAITSLQASMDKYNISASAQRVAAFLANIGVESGGLQLKRENLYYSAARMAQVWPNRYAVDPRAESKQPNALANSLANNPEAFANNVYANRLGNGNEASGDGYNYRGGSYIQITGKSNYQAAFRRIGLPVDSDPSLLTTNKTYASDSAASFFVDAGCLTMADEDRISDIVKAINGALPCQNNNGPLRLSRYAQCVKALS